MGQEHYCLLFFHDKVQKNTTKFLGGSGVVALKVESSGAPGAFPSPTVQWSPDISATEPPLLIPRDIVLYIWLGDASRVPTECLGLLSDGLGTTSLLHYELSVSSRFSAKAGSQSMPEGHPGVPRVGRLGTGMAMLLFLRLSGSFQLQTVSLLGMEKMTLFKRRQRTVLAYEEDKICIGKLDSGGHFGELCRALPSIIPPGVS